MTHGEIIILRLLVSRDLYGYELDRIIEENRMRVWADIGFSSIYSILNKLERREYVSSFHVKESGSPRRKVYRISERGRSGLKEEVMAMLGEVSKGRDDFGVALVVSDILSEDEFRKCLDSYRSSLEAMKKLFTEGTPGSSRKKERVVLAIDRAEALMDAEIAWLKKQ